MCLGDQLWGKKIWGLGGEGVGVRWVRKGGWAPNPLGVVMGVRWVLGMGLPPLDVVVFVGVGVRFKWIWLLVISSIMWLAWKLCLVIIGKSLSGYS